MCVCMCVCVTLHSACDVINPPHSWDLLSDSHAKHSSKVSLRSICQSLWLRFSYQWGFLAVASKTVPSKWTEQSKGSRSSQKETEIQQPCNFKLSGYRCQRGPNVVKWSSTAAAELQGWTIFFSVWLIFTARTLCCERRHNHLRRKWRNQKKANNVQVDPDINAALWLEWFLLRAVFIHIYFSSIPHIGTVEGSCWYEELMSGFYHW